MQRRTGVSRGRLGAVLFTDIVGSTVLAAEMGNRRWAAMISRHHRIVRGELRRFGGREHDTAGDGFFATFERPVGAIRCAAAIAEAVRSLGIEIRAAVTFGELEIDSGKPSGLAVNTAARVMSVAGAGEVLVPASVHDIVSGTEISFDDHGTHELKGIEGQARLFRVTAIEGRSVAPPLEPQEAAERRRQVLPGRSRSGARLVAGAIAAAVAVIAAALLLTGGGPGSPEPTEERAQTYLLELDPEDGSELQRIEITRPGRPSIHEETTRWVEADLGAVWILDPGFVAATLFHVDPEHGEVREPIIFRQPAYHLSMVAAFDAVWIAGDDRLVRVSAATNEQRVIHQLTYRDAGIHSSRISADRSYLWIGRTDGVLMRLTPSEDRTIERTMGDSIDLLVAGDQGVYAIDNLHGEVRRVDSDLHEIWIAPVVGTIGRMVVDDDYVWLLDRGSGIVTRLSTESGAAAQVTVGQGPTDLTVGLGAVWVSHEDGVIRRIDRVTREMTDFVQVQGQASAIAFDERRGSLWVDVDPASAD